jgi:hypothetical protein
MEPTLLEAEVCASGYGEYRVDKRRQGGSESVQVSTMMHMQSLGGGNVYDSV